MKPIQYEGLTPFVIEITELLQRQVVVYGTDLVNALSVTNALCDDSTITLDTCTDRTVQCCGIAGPEDVDKYSGVYDCNGEVEIMTEADYLEQAKEYINTFCSSTYLGEQADFTNLENISIASTSYEEDEEHGAYAVAVKADLAHYEIRTYINEILVSTFKYDTLKEMINIQLLYLDFDDMVYLTDDEWRTYYNTVADRNRAKVDELQSMYPMGTRIRLIRMASDPLPVEPGSTGTVDHVDGAGMLQMRWDCNRSLALIPGVDRFEVIAQ